MADYNPSVINKSKKLALHLRENEAKYISGEKDLNETLKETDELFIEAASAKATAFGVLQDSGLIQLQSKIAKECVKNYQVDTLVFEPRAFCEKIKNRFSPSDTSNRDDSPTRRISCPKLWEKLGEYCKRVEHTVPNFSFIYGTFDADTVEQPLKERKQRQKDVLGEKTKPEAVTPGSQDEQDIMLKDANRVFTIFDRLIKKSENQVMCFYEFVSDPNSFTKTVENIFLVSLLVKEGYVCIFPDADGLPCMRKVDALERKNRNQESMQSVLSMDMEDWKNIVKTFGFTKAVIPPRHSQTVTAGSSQNG